VNELPVYQLFPGAAKEPCQRTLPSSGTLPPIKESSLVELGLHYVHFVYVLNGSFKALLHLKVLHFHPSA
jgi:hypothetical protein